MSYVIKVILTFVVLSQFFPRYDPWFAKDKALHFSVSFTIYNFAYVHTGSDRKSVFLTLSIGLMKEIVDLTLRKTGFSYKDLVYDILGTIFAEST